MVDTRRTNSGRDTPGPALSEGEIPGTSTGTGTINQDVAARSNLRPPPSDNEFNDWVRLATAEFMVNNSLLEVIKSAKESYSYTGLDISRMRRYVYNHLRDHGHDNNAIIKLLAEAMVLSLTRGNNIVSARRRMSPQGQAKLDILVEAFGLKEKINASDPNPTVTLSRLQVAFPECAFKVAKIIEVRCISDMTDDAFPFGMRTSSFGSLIPKSPEFIILKKAYLVYTSQVSLVLRRQPTAHVNKKVISTQLNFLNTSISSSTIPTADRINLLKEGGHIIPADYVSGIPNFPESVKNMAAVYDRVMAVQYETSDLM